MNLKWNLYSFKIFIQEINVCYYSSENFSKRGDIDSQMESSRYRTWISLSSYGIENSKNIPYISYTSGINSLYQTI